MTTYGYVRRQYPLPTNDQLKIVSDYHCETIFIEQSHLGTREEFHQLIAHLGAGDTVVIASLQVFGKDAAIIASCLEQLRDKQVQLISWSTQLHLNYYKRTSGLL